MLTRRFTLLVSMLSCLFLPAAVRGQVNSASLSGLVTDQTNAALTMTMSQQLPVSGGSFFVSSSLARLSVTGQNLFGGEHAEFTAPATRSQFGPSVFFKILSRF